MRKIEKTIKGANMLIKSKSHDSFRFRVRELPKVHSDLTKLTEGDDNHASSTKKVLFETGDNLTFLAQNLTSKEESGLTPPFPRGSRVCNGQNKRYSIKR